MCKNIRIHKSKKPANANKLSLYLTNYQHYITRLFELIIPSSGFAICRLTTVISTVRIANPLLVAAGLEIRPSGSVCGVAGNLALRFLQQLICEMLRALGLREFISVIDG